MGRGAEADMARDERGEILKMAGQTKYYGFGKPTAEEYVEIDLLNENFDAIDAALKEIAESGVRVFDNPLAYPDCIRKTTLEAGNWKEQITDAEGSLKAERVTQIASAADITETYTFYDGKAIAAKFTIHTTKDAAGSWKEEIRREREA